MKLFALLKKDLLILLRNRVELAVLFLMPRAFIIPICIALGAGDGYGIHASDQMVSLPVANYDKGPRAQALMTAIGESLKLEVEASTGQLQSLNLAEDPDCAQTYPEIPQADPACIEKVGRAQLQASQRSAVLIIPAGFSAAVDAGQPVRLSLLYDPAGNAVQLQQIQAVLRGAAAAISLKNQVNDGLGMLNDLVAFAPDAVRKPIQNQTSTPQPQNQPPAISLEKTFPIGSLLTPTPDTYQQTIPGYTVMFVFFLVAYIAGSIHQEKLLGALRRLVRTPVSRAELFGGKLLAAMLVGLAQVLILFGVGAVVFQLDLGDDPLAFFLLTLALVAAATAIGLAAATTRLRGGQMVVLLVIAALLGGCLFPLEMTPQFLRILSYLVPHSWAMSGYQDLMVRGLGLQDVFPQILILAGFTVLFSWVALRRFHFVED